MTPLFRKLGWLARRHSREEELTEELRFHLEEEAGERREAGQSEEEARWAARRELGNLGLVREETRAAWGWTLIEQLVQDLRYAARTIRRNPTFTMLAALSLALGIGANTAIYSFMQALLLRPLPVANPEALVVLNWHLAGKKNIHNSVQHRESGYSYQDPKTGRTTGIFPYPAFERLRQVNGVLSDLFAYRPAGGLTVVVQGQAGKGDGEYVSGGYFRGLGLAPVAGRLIDSDDDRAGGPAVAVLSYALARGRFSDAGGAVGQPVQINNVPFTVIGVTPPEFFGVDPGAAPEVYLPMHADLLFHPASDPNHNPARDYLDEHYYWIGMMGRMGPGMTMERAQAALGPVFERWAAATATNDEERRNLPGESAKKT